MSNQWKIWLDGIKPNSAKFLFTTTGSKMKNVFLGLTIISDCVNFSKPDLVAAVLVGRYDDVLLEAFFYTRHQKVPENGEHKTDEHANGGLQNMKDFIRNSLNHIFQEAEREDQRKRLDTLLQVRDELKQSNQPHSLGTVAEIAARHGISKSEVRRRKADGTLESFLDGLKL